MTSMMPETRWMIKAETMGLEIGKEMNIGLETDK